MGKSLVSCFFLTHGVVVEALGNCPVCPRLNPALHYTAVSANCVCIQHDIDKSQLSFIELCKTLRTNSGSRDIIADCGVWTHPHFYTDLRPWLWRALQNISGVGGWRKVALGITSVKGFVQYSICCSINSEYIAFPIVGNSWRHLLTVHRPSQTQIVHKFLALFLICLSFTIGHFHTYFAKNAAYIIFPFNSWISFQRQCRLLWG